jgi:lysophospholipase L1-like esterase
MSQAQWSEDRLPRRDYVLLPLIVLSVTIALLGISDVVANHVFPSSGRFTCIVRDRLGFLRGKANCICHYKNPEGPLVEYRFNECGYRSTKPCGRKPDGMVRIVLMGASLTWGLHIPGNEVFGNRVEEALNQICTRPIEVQNMGGMIRLRDEYKLIDEALSLSPDVIVLTVAPNDLEQLVESPQSSPPPTILGRAKLAWHDLLMHTRDVRFVLAVQHFMLMDKQVLFDIYGNIGNSRLVLQSPQTPAGEQMYTEFGKALDRVMTKMQGSGVPLIIMAVPNRVAAALVSNRSHLDGTDPWWFGRHISEIAIERGALAVDATNEFANSPHAEQLFYPVDNHPNGDGHAVVAKALMDRLTDGSIPHLTACRVTTQLESHKR